MLAGMLVTHPDHPGTLFMLLSLRELGTPGRGDDEAEFSLTAVDPATGVYLDTPKVYTRVSPLPLPPCEVCGPRYPLSLTLGPDGEWVDGGTWQPAGLPCTPTCPAGTTARMTVTA